MRGRGVTESWSAQASNAYDGQSRVHCPVGLVAPARHGDDSHGSTGVWRLSGAKVLDPAPNPLGFSPVPWAHRGRYRRPEANEVPIGRMTAPTGLSITQIRNAATGAANENEEWVRIVNDGPSNWDIRGWLVTDETDQQLRPHVYVFPATLAAGQSWTFDPGEAIYLFSGRGQDRFYARPSSGRPQFHFYWNRDAMVWNNAGDRVYVRKPDGTFATQPFPIP
jgi:hypothetical protein